MIKKRKKKLLLIMIVALCPLYGCKSEGKTVPEYKVPETISTETIEENDNFEEEKGTPKNNGSDDTFIENEANEDGWKDNIADNIIKDVGNWPGTICAYYNPLYINLNSFHKCLVTAQTYAGECEDGSYLHVDKENFEKRMYQYFGMSTDINEFVDYMNQNLSINVCRNADGTIGLSFLNEDVDYRIVNSTIDGKSHKVLVEYDLASVEYVFTKYENSKYGFVIKDATYYSKGYDPEYGVNDETILDYLVDYYSYCYGCYLEKKDIIIEESKEKKLIVSIPSFEQVEYDGYTLAEKNPDKRITITVERKTLDYYTDEEDGGEAQNLLDVDFW